MGTQINELVKTGVVFDRGQVRPAYFIWKGRRYEVREVTQRWQTTDGSAAILHLGVSDGTNVFELAFNQHTLTWRLAAVETSDGE